MPANISGYTDVQSSASQSQSSFDKPKWAQTYNNKYRDNNTLRCTNTNNIISIQYCLWGCHGREGGVDL